jgi:hypothetical protein
MYLYVFHCLLPQTKPSQYRDDCAYDPDDFYYVTQTNKTQCATYTGHLPSSLGTKSIRDAMRILKTSLRSLQPSAMVSDGSVVFR